MPTIAANFKEMPRNVRVSLAVLPLWSIPNTLVVSYASLYMINQGVSASKVGLINSLSFILKTILAIFAGYIINRFGRRVTTGVLDFLGWSVPMLIYFFATNFWMFLLASLINCITVINNISSQCFMVEDVDQDKRIRGFSFSSVIGSVCGLFVPITGLLIQKVTLVPAIRALYMFAFISMGTAAVCKLIFYRETSVGRKLMAERVPLGNPFKNLLKPAHYILGNRKLILLFSMNILLQFALIINNLYYFPFLTKALHYSDSYISMFPFFTTAVGLFVFFIIIPRIRNMGKAAYFSVAMYATGALALLIARVTVPQVAFVCVLCWALGLYTMTPVLNTMIANTIKDELRTEVFSLFSLVSMLCMFPAGFVGGLLFDISPVYPVIFLFAVYVSSFLILVISGRKAGFGINDGAEEKLLPKEESI